MMAPLNRPFDAQFRRVLRRIAASFLVALTAAVGGCAARAPIRAWQDALTQYVDRQGGGDPTILRETVDLHSRRGLRPGRVTFSATGLPVGGASWRQQDVHGVLVDVVRDGERTWFIFLVGVLRDGSGAVSQLADVRAVALRVEPGTQHWRVGSPNEVALRQYKARSAARGSTDGSHICPVRFPGNVDVFEASAAAGFVTITEANSGAAWSVRLSEPGGGRMAPQN